MNILKKLVFGVLVMFVTFSISLYLITDDRDDCLIKINKDTYSDYIYHPQWSVSDVVICMPYDSDSHKIRFDEKSIRMTYNLVKGKNIKSYMTHGSRSGSSDRLLTEIGFFNNFYMKDDVLYGTFQFLPSYARNNPSVVDQLHEMIKFFPGQFGVSMVLTHDYSVINRSGLEIKIDTHTTSVYQFAYLMSESMYRYPVARPTFVDSIDWVQFGALTPTGVFMPDNYIPEEPKLNPLPPMPVKIRHGAWDEVPASETPTVITPLPPTPTTIKSPEETVAEPTQEKSNDTTSEKIPVETTSDVFTVSPYIDIGDDSNGIPTIYGVETSISF